MEQRPSEEMGGRIPDSQRFQRETLLSGMETAQMAEHTQICMCKVSRLGWLGREPGTRFGGQMNRETPRKSAGAAESF